MNQKVDGSTEIEGIERLGWKGIFSEEGPKFEVPRLVWRAVFGLVFLLGLVPFFLMGGAVRYRWNATFIGYFSLTLIAMVYFRSWESGTRAFIRWLFGPKPERKRHPRSTGGTQ